MHDQALIYALADPETGRVRYVGRTTYEPTKRLAGYIGQALAGSKFINQAMKDWICGLERRGLRPALVPLEAVPVDEMLVAEDFWIAQARALNGELLNARTGASSSSERLVRAAKWVPPPKVRVTPVWLEDSPQRLRAARVAIKWSRAELAKRAMIAETTLAAIERGTHIPRATTLRQIRSALHDGGVNLRLEGPYVLEFAEDTGG